MRRVLILGGTAEARRLAAELAGRSDLDVILSLAGRTAAPAPHAVPVRVGGFGGAEGLANYLAAERIDALIDATHPYAITISANAAYAARQARTPMLALRRPPWIATVGDHWIEVPDVVAAAHALGQEPRRVFLALGRKELAPFVEEPQHYYLVRSVEPIDPPLAVPHASYLTARGPFHEAEERALLATNRIAVIVAKNSGGRATYGKVAAGRALGLPVIMLRRPPLADTAAVTTVEEACAWLGHTLGHVLTVSTARGV